MLRGLSIAPRARGTRALAGKAAGNAPKLDLKFNEMVIGPQRIFAGTDFGIWLSVDGGGTWGHMVRTRRCRLHTVNSNFNPEE